MTNRHFAYEITIREHHLDTFGHVNNAVYLELFEEARWEYITLNGYGLKEIQKSGIGPTILEIQLRFLKEIRLRQKIIIDTHLLSYQRKIAKLEQTIKNEQNEICCKAQVTFGLFDTKLRKLISPTPEWMLALGGPGATTEKPD